MLADELLLYKNFVLKELQHYITVNCCSAALKFSFHVSLLVKQFKKSKSFLYVLKKEILFHGI